MIRTHTKRPLLCATLGLAALASAQAAHAQQVCIAPKDAAATVMYLMPVAYDAAMKSCKKEFGDDSFMTSSDGRSFIEKFRTQADNTWPGAYRVAQFLIASQGAGDDGMAQTLGELDEKQLRPFADALIGQMIAEEIKPEACDKVDRGMELMSPLPAENVGGLVSFILEMVDLGDSEVPVCNADGTVRAKPQATPSE